MPGATPELNHAIVRAGAGAGKTTGLVERVREVYGIFQARGERPRIIVTTFTRKATQELKERLILKACRTEDAGFLQFVTDPSRLQITTIHGLLNIFLRQVGHLAGLDAGFQIVSEGEGAEIARRSLRETLLENPEAIGWLETYGFARLLEMCRRYETLKRERGELKPATIEDIEAASESVFKEWREKLDEYAASVLEEVDDPKWATYVEKIRQIGRDWRGGDVELPRKPNGGPGNEVVKEFKKETERECWRRELWPEMVSAWASFQSVAEDFAERNSRVKDTQSRFEMVDLELKSIEILRAKPFLGSIFSENWDYWMIDEYQDTSPLQVECLSALIGDRPTYYVGDPQQSIYLFRGAEVRVFDQAQAEVAGKGGEVRELLRNYRSEPDLLQWINDFMASLGPAFRAMEPREGLPSSDRACVRMIRAVDEEAEMHAVVRRVHELVREGVPLDQICVLGRTHRTLMDASRALRAQGFPTHVHSARGFTERREVMDAQALWKFLVNPHDNLALLTLLRSPWFYVEDSKLATWMESKPASLWRKLQDEEVPESVGRLVVAQDMLARAGLARTFEQTLVEAAMIDLSLVNDPAGRKESNLWKLILKARELESEGGQSVLDFLEGGSGDPLDAAEGDATSAQEPNAINLMTIHGSKGLEFAHVIVPRMGEKPNTSNKALPLSADERKFYFPLWDDREGKFITGPLDYARTRRETARELAEFDRWLYVALTRAKSTLTLTWSKVETNSWASRSSWFTREAGEHRTDRYRFEILDGEHLTALPTYHGGPDQEKPVRARYRQAPESHRERRAVTEMIADRAQGVPREDLLRRWQAQNRGTAIHRALEALKYGEPDMSDEAVRFVLELNDPPMRELIHNGEVEWGFQVQTPARVVDGQIDLWSKHEGKLYVIDYKSGSAAFKESAFEQLSVYAWALRKFGHQEPCELVVIYPLVGKVEKRGFSEESFAGWEAKFSRAET